MQNKINELNEIIIENQNETIKQLKEQMQNTYETAQDLLSEMQMKIDKAIEYLKNNSMCPDDIEVWGQVEYDIYKILKGNI